MKFDQNLKTNDKHRIYNAKTGKRGGECFKYFGQNVQDFDQNVWYLHQNVRDFDQHFRVFDQKLTHIERNFGNFDQKVRNFD